MKLPEILKKAVLEQNWEIVCKAYTALTGEPLEVPKPAEPDYLQLDIDLGADYTDTKAEPKKRGRPPVKKKFEPTQLEKREESDPVLIFPNGKPNAFSDDGEVPHVPKTGSKELPLYDIVKPRERKQDTTTDTIPVICSLCGLEEDVSPVFALGWIPKALERPEADKYNTYKCNVCCSPSGRKNLNRAEATQERNFNISPNRGKY